MAKGKSFSATVEDWVRRTDARMTGVFRVSARLAAEEMSRPIAEGGAMPKLTGRLGRSLAASLSGMPPVDWRAKDFDEPAGQIEAVIAGAGIGQTIYLGFRAPYAQQAELADGHGFVRLTAQHWPQIVSEAVRRVKAADGGR